jgi:hypothetical protein
VALLELFSPARIERIMELHMTPHEIEEQADGASERQGVFQIIGSYFSPTVSSSGELAGEQNEPAYSDELDGLFETHR